MPPPNGDGILLPISLTYFLDNDRYDEELQLEVNTLYAEFNEKVLAGMPMTKLNVKELNDARVEACEFYYSKHREVLEPIVARIENEVEREIKSGMQYIIHVLGSKL